MKFKGPIFFSFLLAFLLFAAFYKPIDNSEKEAVLIHSILDGLNRYHYSPKNVDDSFSETLFNLYQDRIDGGRRWLTQEDLETLETYKLHLDDEAVNGNYEYFDLSLTLFKQGVEKTEAYSKEILAEPFDFSIKEEYQLDGEKREYAPNDKELREAWRKLLKYETLTRLEGKLETQEKGEDEELEGLSYEELEEMCRDEVLKAYDGLFERLAKRDRSDYLTTYLNSVTNVFDPHTGYFEPVQKQNFDINLSGKLEGIGARLQSDGEYTKITSVVVGGPAWKQGELKENDKITKVAQGDEDPVDITGMDLDDVVSLIRGKKGTKVRLTVKKVDGTVEEISIIRDLVILEEGFARSLLLHTSAKEKVGYIYLPRFYDDFSDENGRSCAEDVAKELKKLKAQKAKGIILDLRNNPGGSLRDVVTMSGLFVETGPVVQVKSRDRTADVLRDIDPSVSWDGPLIIMVNSFSASASEIIAAAMQDYERAVIVGSPSTYGKGTVQRFIDLDRSVSGHSEIKPLGAIKLTIQKFYRIDGGSVQLRGVEPDIVLPDDYYYLEMGEKDNKFPMEWTEIGSVPHPQQVYRIRNLDQLKSKSAKRIKKNTIYQEILSNATRLKTQRENSVYSLNLENYQVKQDQIQVKVDAYNELFEKVVVFGIENLPSDLDFIEAEEGRKARNDDWVENVRKDVHLQETLNVMHDMISK